MGCTAVGVAAGGLRCKSSSCDAAPRCGGSQGLHREGVATKGCAAGVAADGGALQVGSRWSAMQQVWLLASVGLHCNGGSRDAALRWDGSQWTALQQRQLRAALCCADDSRQAASEVNQKLHCVR